ncbi:MAG: 4-aminobutyrate aminotransferase-like enzyme/Ser/Thr protein kinase RdoA (MazF antagonist) [Flavobacteriales bacterium]|jgi:4-aminobutyrate aminotransferase-like enzyme/Ser/Thr protein kinase RdoA (MazF antagonist)
MKSDYSAIQISKEEATAILKQLYAIDGKAKELPGETDFNFKIESGKQDFILKVSRPGANEDELVFQDALLEHVSNSEDKILAPKTVHDVNGKSISSHQDEQGQRRLVRLLTWVEGRLWSSVNPRSEALLNSLGTEAGRLTKCLSSFDHPFAHRTFDWDLASSKWTADHTHLLEEPNQKIALFFQAQFDAIQEVYSGVRKSVVHNDPNDNNVLVSEDLQAPKVLAIIDYGDAVFTHTINDLAICLAYAIMGKNDPLSAACDVVKGYHNQFPLREIELECLFSLIAMRLLTTVTKSAINKEKEPDNAYLLVSEKPAWDALCKWREVAPNLAYFAFRHVCGFSSHPANDQFQQWAKSQSLQLTNLFPALEKKAAIHVDISVGSTWLGHVSKFGDVDFAKYKFAQLQRQNEQAIIAGGYLEHRAVYTSDAYVKEGNNGKEYRSVHLGVDFWVEEGTPLTALFDGKVKVVHNNANDKDYGPTIILEHSPENGPTFYTLYGHLSVSSLSLLIEDEPVKAGQLIGYIGARIENGGWLPHLHLQVMLDMLGNTHDFPGVALPNDLSVWKSVCPDPNLFFNLPELTTQGDQEPHDLIAFRKEHLGASLSISYDEPINFVRGEGAFLIDVSGRKYLDTVNNVAHVGHEHARVVNAGQSQMALLNTNTRYLHENVNSFAKELLETFPDELTVVHFVNSGSEANELALRMATAVTGHKDMIAVEIGYHGNTNACIDISSYKFDGKGGKGAPEHTHIVPLPDTFRGLYRGENTGPSYAQHVQDQIEAIHAKGRELSGFICESIISCGGQVELPEGYLEMAYEVVRKAGGVAIADEVQVGCGRVGKKFWGFQLHDVIPDIVTIGKPLGNGHPLAAVVCTRKVADAFANGMEYFNTFGGNPVSCAIGREVLRVVKDEKLQENALEIGNFLKSGLKSLQDDYPIIGDVRGQGLFLGFELTDEGLNPLPEQASYLANRMKTLGVLMSTDGKDHNALKIKPPMVFSRDNAGDLLCRIELVLQEDFMQISSFY